MTSHEKLVAEKATLEMKMQRARNQYETAAARFEKVNLSIRMIEERDRLALLVGIAGGVKVRFRRAPGEANAWLNDTHGTLTKIGRTRAHVDFGPQGQWTFPMTDIVAAADRQGVTFAAMDAGDMGDVPNR
jgi:hypothetical protein